MNLYKPVGEIMTTDLTTVTDDTPVKELKSLFKRRSIHHILVENNVGLLLGIISTEDVSRTAHFPVKEEELVARHIMTVNPEKVTASMPVKQVVDAFLDNRYRAIPVINKDEVLIGIVTPYDVMAELMDSFQEEDIHEKSIDDLT